MDLCHSRRDDEQHLGDPQPQSMAAVYGPRPPWHDVQLAITGPAVGDVETVFRERWEDPHAPSRTPFHWAADALRRRPGRGPTPLPPQLPDPPEAGPHAVQLLRTYPRRLRAATRSPRKASAASPAGTARRFGRARHLIYVEDQYLWSREVAAVFARALRDRPELRLIAVLPHHPDQDGRLACRPASGRVSACSGALTGRPRDGWPSTVSRTTAGTPVYVHAKVCVIDDEWAVCGLGQLQPPLVDA